MKTTATTEPLLIDDEYWALEEEEREDIPTTVLERVGCLDTDTAGGCG